jgi:predicted AAA+ superfamily ATPase
MSKNNYFFRKIDADLLAWSKAEDHKVLLLRGARQVGKSSAVKQLAKKFEYFLEIDFEADRETRTFFESGSLSPQPIIEQLSIKYGMPVIAGKTLLFFDEIQACVSAISSLRYFYEKMPDLHVIAAGSLLDFALEKIPSFGVGRITSIFMYPFSFYEFLNALGENLLLEAIQKASVENPLHEVIHNKAVEQLKRFLVVGGMPDAVAKYAKTGDLLQAQTILSSLIVSLKNDFAKYRKHVPLTRLNEVFESVARQAEGKFVYEKAATQTTNAQVKQALEMLVMAGLVIPITHTTANDIPLGAEINLKFQRMFLFDTGLFQRVLGLDLSQIFVSSGFKTTNRGALAEIFVGLELLKNASCYSPISLYYWQREKSQGDAQVDFLIQKGEEIVPIEVKAGTQGAMQSLRWFMKEKNRKKGIRTSLENFACYEDIDVYPMYAISNVILNDKQNIL